MMFIPAIILLLLMIAALLALRISEKKYRDLYDNAPDMYYRLNRNGVIIDCNETTVNMLGYSRDEITGMPITNFMTEESNRLFHQTFLRLSEVKGYRNLEREFIRKDGTSFPVILNVYGEFDDAGTLLRTKTIARDITERKRLEEQLHCISITDELTGLLNRRGFFTLVDQQLKIAERNRKRVFFLYADLDNMKAVNDTYGHHEGDRVLASTAQILRETFRDSDIIARIGGDEFAVLMIDYAMVNVERTIVDRIQEKVKIFNEWAIHPHKLSISMGIVLYDPENPCSAHELLNRADRCMYENKRNRS